MKKLLMSVMVLVFLGVLAGCGSLPSAPQAGATTPSPGATTAPSTATPQPPAPSAPVPFSVASVALSVNPTSIAGTTCGSLASFTYTATFHIPAHTAGGTIQFGYTLNNGRSQTTGTVTVGAGETSKTFTFVSSGTLSADHTYPGVAIVMVTSPNNVLSPPVIPSGICVAPGSFQVTAVSMAVSPTSIQGLKCGTYLTVTYTATFHLASNGPGGTIQFEYTVNNGRGSTPASIAVAAGQTTASYSFRWSGNLPVDHTYPEPGGVIVHSPNTITSSLLGPSGTCS
ncbi:MAG TPA: hypothetical protein VKR83_13380 [Ktedonobacteraceae bacterium]|nr:hypothetical protein [Ktedonobacteraceae bacterium]